MQTGPAFARDVHSLSVVIAGHSRPKDGGAPLAYDPAIHDDDRLVQSLRLFFVALHHGCSGQARA
jgi:hypothetical protein